MKTKAVLIVTFVALSCLRLSAQDLKIPTGLFLATAAADWTSTAYCETSPSCHEANPMFAWAEPRLGVPGMIALGGATDALTVWALHRAFARRHPRLLSVGLYVSAAMRMSIAVHNTRVGAALRGLTPQGPLLNLPPIPLSR